MRIRRLGRLIGAASLLAVVALPGTVSAQGGLPGGGGGGGGGLLLSVPFVPTTAFPHVSASIAVSSARVNLTANGTGLPLGSLICLKENTTLLACAVIDPFTGIAAFPHLAFTSISLLPGSTFTLTQGIAGPTIASVTLH